MSNKPSTPSAPGPFWKRMRRALGFPRFSPPSGGSLPQLAHHARDSALATPPLRLFFGKDPSGFVHILQGLGLMDERVVCRPFNADAHEFHQAYRAAGGTGEVFSCGWDDGAQLPDGVARLPHSPTSGLSILFETDPDRLSALLLEYVHASDCTLLAPITSSFYANRPLYVITIPKSGTHLLFELLGAMGYPRSQAPPEAPAPGHWHVLMGNNTHTKCIEFMRTINWESPAGREHPFFTSPVVFNYRHPLDVVISECNYMLRHDRTPLAYYFNSIDTADLYSSVMRRSVISSIRTRILDYAPWLKFPNLIAVSYEELVGARGGGSDSEQIATIWSMQLKLHIPGEPDVFAARIYNEHSVTFNKGQIGAFKREFTPREYEALSVEGADFITTLGYDLTSSSPRLAKDLRTKALKITKPPPAANWRAGKPSARWLSCAPA